MSSNHSIELLDSVFDALTEKCLAFFDAGQQDIFAMAQDLMDLDGVELCFKPEALQLIAKQAIDRKSGARGLRAIIEELLLDVMFDIPSRNDIRQVIITPECVEGKEAPQLVLTESAQPKKLRSRAPKKDAADQPAGDEVS